MAKAVAHRVDAAWPVHRARLAPDLHDHAVSVSIRTQDARGVKFADRIERCLLERWECNASGAIGIVGIMTAFGNTHGFAYDAPACHAGC